MSEAGAGRLQEQTNPAAAPRRFAGRRCRDCGTGCPGKSDAARDSAVLPEPRARSRTPPGVSIESSSCSCRSRGEPSLSYSCAPSTRSVLKKLTNVSTPNQTIERAAWQRARRHQREHAREGRQHRELPSPHAPHHRGLHHAAVVGIHRERRRVDLEPAMESRPEQADRRDDHEPEEQQRAEPAPPTAARRSTISFRELANGRYSGSAFVP